MRNLSMTTDLSFTREENSLRTREISPQLSSHVASQPGGFEGGV
jgi:hypothetical protein